MANNGFPIVISTNGAPFMSVASGAPLATVASNGFGAPVNIVASNAPALVVEGMTPPEEPVSFTLWAGSGNGGDIGYYTTIYGSIESEPMPGFPLIEMASRNSGYFQVAFRGDVSSNLAGYKPVVEGVTIGAVIQDWQYDENGNSTSATWGSTGSMVNNTEYSITWSNAV